VAELVADVVDGDAVFDEFDGMGVTKAVARLKGPPSAGPGPPVRPAGEAEGAEAGQEDGVGELAAVPGDEVAGGVGQHGGGAGWRSWPRGGTWSWR